VDSFVRVVRVSRPSPREVDEALATAALVVTGALKLDRDAARAWLSVLQAATRSRPVWPAKEAAECLGVLPENLQADRLRGLPEPAQVLARSTRAHPNRVERLWFQDEIEELARRRAERTER
jgi:hypothetical protein